MNRPDGPRERAWRPQLIGLVAACSTLFVALYVAVVRSQWGQRLEHRVLRGGTQHAEVRRLTERMLATISVSSLALSGAALALLALVRGRPRLAIGVVIALAGANVTTQVLKPALEYHDVTSPFAVTVGYPSGHATVAMSLAGALLLVVPARIRPAVAVPAACYAIAIGTGTVTAGWHRPSDVIGGYLVAAAWVAMAAAWVERREDTEAASEAAAEAASEPRRTTTTAVVVAALLATASLALSVGLVAVTARRLELVHLSGAYVAGLITVAAAGAATVIGLTAALRHP